MDPTLLPILNKHFERTAAGNVINGLLRSAEDRKSLVALISRLNLTRDQSFRDALHADEERIAILLGAILDSEAERAAVLNLRDDAAQRFLDVVQTTLDRGFMMRQEDSSKARLMIHELAVHSHNIPSSLFVSVAHRESDSIMGGAFSDIYKACFQGKKVAVKVIREFHRGSDLHRFRSNFYREALVWKELDHPNILRFIGVDRETFAPSVGMVSPWMANGNILQYLDSHGRDDVNKLLFDIARGLQYLHSRNIVHGDLRAANVLIDDEPKACLADLGLSLLTDIPAERTPGRGGGIRWTAAELIDPESFGTQFSPTTASDVYAFGCVCLELFTGQPPFANLSDVRTLFMVMAGSIPERPAKTDPILSDKLWQLMKNCWAKDRSSRPSMEQVVRSLAGMEFQPSNQQDVEVSRKSSTPPPQYTTIASSEWIQSLPYSVPVPAERTVEQTHVHPCYKPSSTLNGGALESDETRLDIFHQDGEEMHPATESPGMSQMPLLTLGFSPQREGDSRRAEDAAGVPVATHDSVEDLVEDLDRLSGGFETSTSMFKNSPSVGKGEIVRGGHLQENAMAPDDVLHLDPEVPIENSSQSGCPEESVNPQRPNHRSSRLTDPGRISSVDSHSRVLRASPRSGTPPNASAGITTFG
ncbi:kinase-like domain-containing protein [Mycena crocata]|nr:kinase-like domain-containing protein [Mycena crocata]